MIDSSLLPIADLPEAIIPLVATIFFLMIPIVAILTRHQQKMALLMRNDGQFPQANPMSLHNPPTMHQPVNFGSQSNNEIQALRQDVQQLREMVSALTINVDNINDQLKRQTNVQERIRNGE